MVRFPSVQRLNIFCFISLYLVSLVFLLSVWFLLKPHQSISFEEKVQNLAVLPSDTTGSNAILFTAEDLKNALVKSDGVLAATRKNRGKTKGSVACVVDPGITECGNAGFAAFLLYTLDHILFCRALGINRPTVFWRACLSGCSKDPRVNSWDWYFEPVNRGLESEVQNVFCPLTLDDSPSIIENSFKNRSDVVGYEDSKIITTQERLRVNKLIHQYVKPNSGITKKVQMFYQQYLAGFNVLGVQVRGTDHWMETSEKKLPSLMSWVKKAQSILETLPRPRKIFIASDNNEVIRKFVIYFGKETVSFTLPGSSPLYCCPFQLEHTTSFIIPQPRKIGFQWGVLHTFEKPLALPYLYKTKIFVFPYPTHT